MSLRVLVISEDPTLDQHILKPVVERLFDELGRRSRVEIHEPPRGHARGVAQALDRDTLAGVIEDRPMFSVFLLIVDRDGDLKRADRVSALVREHPDKLVACLAVEEVETWMLALHRAALSAPWPQVRAERDPKERYAEPFLRERGWSMELGKGRKRAMRDIGAQWAGLLQVCPEIAELRDALGVLLIMDR